MTDNELSTELALINIGLVNILKGKPIRVSKGVSLKRIRQLVRDFLTDTKPTPLVPVPDFDYLSVLKLIDTPSDIAMAISQTITEPMGTMLIGNITAMLEALRAQIPRRQRTTLTGSVPETPG